VHAAAQVTQLVGVAFEPVGGHEIPQPPGAESAGQAGLRHRGLIDRPPLLEGFHPLLGVFLVVRQGTQITDEPRTPAGQWIPLIFRQPHGAHPIRVVGANKFPDAPKQMHQRLFTPGCLIRGQFIPEAMNTIL
jgi:hypothetical protein